MDAQLRYYMWKMHISQSDEICSSPSRSGKPPEEEFFIWDKCRWVHGWAGIVPNTFPTLPARQSSHLQQFPVDKNVNSPLHGIQVFELHPNGPAKDLISSRVYTVHSANLHADDVGAYQPAYQSLDYSANPSIHL